MASDFIHCILDYEEDDGDRAYDCDALQRWIFVNVMQCGIMIRNALFVSE